MLVGRNHIHIMELMDVATFDGYGALILELATEGNLQDVYRRVSQDHHAALSQRVAYEMIEALHHIHSQNPAIVHRDIKPDNILVFLSGTVRKPCYLFKLADFGIPQTVDDDDEDPAFPGVFHQPMSGRAFRPYRAPETAKELGDIHPRGFESKADIYSLGVVLSKIHNNNVGNPDQPPLHDIPARYSCTSSASHQSHVDTRFFEAPLSPGLQEISLVQGRSCSRHSQGCQRIQRREPPRREHETSEHRVVYGTNVQAPPWPTWS